MKMKFSIPFFAFSFFSISVLAQTENKKTDTIKPAKEVILKNSGEKDFPQQLKENQLKEQPVILNSDSSNTAKANSKRTKGMCIRHSKKKRS
jgi:hypothetical protein